MTVMAAPAAAQQKQQWTDVIYVPGRWQSGTVVAPAAPDTLALVMRIEYFSKAPRWRAEVQRTTDGVNFSEPVVVIGDKQNALVVTPVGTTPLAQHALGRDPLGLALVVFDAAGKRTGVASGAFVDKDASGATTRIGFRRTARAATFADDALNPRNQTFARQIISNRLATVGDQRSAAVVATAGARGVDRVTTKKGVIEIKPDSMAVKRMEAFTIREMRLEEFLRTGGLGPYKQGGQQ